MLREACLYVAEAPMGRLEDGLHTESHQEPLCDPVTGLATQGATIEDIRLLHVVHLSTLHCLLLHLRRNQTELAFGH